MMRGILYTLLGVSGVLAQDWPVQTYQTEDFTVPSFTVQRTGTTEDGSLFLGYFKTEDASDQAPIIVQDTGDLIWRGPSGNPIYNFRPQTLNGQTVLTFWSGFLDYQGHGFGNVTILDQQYNQIMNVCLPPSERIYNPRKDYPGNVQYPCYVDKHESFITPQGTILLTAYNATQTDLTPVGGKKNGWVWDCLVYELDLSDQSILFKWSAVEHVPVQKSNYVNTNGSNLLNIGGHHFGTRQQPWDFFHVNSIQKVNDNYLINSRMTWSFYMVDGTSSDIIWTLEGSHGGDFTFPPDAFFSWQHMPRVESQSTNPNAFQISLFNNDNIPLVAAGTNSSSGYLFNVNTDTMEATVLRDLLPQQPIYATAEGSYQALDNDHVLVGFGAIPIVEEFDENDDIIYTAQFGPNAQGTAHSYRAYRFPWTSTPNTSPKVAASLGTKNQRLVTVYMSWNGATEYDSWNVYAGRTQDDLTKVASNVARDGFETKTSFKKGSNKYKYVMAEALQSGTSLGNSTVMRIPLKSAA